MKKKLLKVVLGGIFVLAIFFSLTFNVESTNAFPSIAVKNAEALAGTIYCSTSCKPEPGDICLLCAPVGYYLFTNYNENGLVRPVVWQE